MNVLAEHLLESVAVAVFLFHLSHLFFMHFLLWNITFLVALRIIILISYLRDMLIIIHNQLWLTFIVLAIILTTDRPRTLLRCTQIVLTDFAFTYSRFGYGIDFFCILIDSLKICTNWLRIITVKQLIFSIW